MKKRTKLSSSAFKSVKDLATSVSGYDDKSPIWGKRLPEVLDLVARNLDDAQIEIDNGEYSLARDLMGEGAVTIYELRKRLAKNAVIAQARNA